jgi:hypothetical protein
VRILKGVVLLLVLANVGYYLYAHGIATSVPEAPVAAAAPAPASAPLPAPLHAPKVPVRCVSIGPFVELADSNHAQSTLRGAGYLPRQRSAESEVADGLLVYLPMPTAATAVVQLRRRLKAAGIADAPDVPGPGDAIVISLGAYSDQPHAQARVNALRQQGFAPLTVERKRSGLVFWLDVDLKPTDPELNPADLHGEAVHGPALEIHDCPGPLVPATAPLPAVPGAGAVGASVADASAASGAAP